MRKNTENQFEPAAVFETATGIFVARYLDCAPINGRQVSRLTNANAAIELADDLNKAKKEGK